LRADPVLRQHHRTGIGGSEQIKPMGFDELAAHLTSHRDDIIDRWRALVRRDPSQPTAAGRLSDRDLDNHLPSLIDKLADALRARATPDVEPEGKAHGRARRILNYTIPQILLELRLFRQVLMDVVLEFGRQRRGDEADLAEARERILDVIDRSMTASAEQYTTDTEAERNAAWETVQDRTAQLEQRTRALEEAARQKNQFLAMLSHELRNPISAILSAARLLANAALEPRHERARQIITRQGRYQARLLDDLLEVHRMVLGKFTLTKRPVDLRDAIRQALEACAGSIEAKHLHVHLALPDVSLLMLGDPTRLVQVMTNLLSNAAKFTRDRGHVWLAAEEQHQRAIVRIRDDGIGISAELLPRIFDMFTQADTSLDRTSAGLGVGLTFAKHLIEAHGGGIEARSAGLGAGAEFIVELPLVGEVERQRLAPTRLAAAPRIAVVEDNADSRVVLADVLESMGFTVLTAEDGEKALRLAEQERLHAYIIDLGLPGLDGYEVARRIRRMPAAERALLIALTGYGTPEDKRRAAEAGFDHHFTKPADFDALAEVLRNLG
jgi:signal transduction histidine kinase